MSPLFFGVYVGSAVPEVGAGVLGRGLELLRASDARFEMDQLFVADDATLVAGVGFKLCELMSGFGGVCKGSRLRLGVGKDGVMECSGPITT